MTEAVQAGRNLMEANGVPPDMMDALAEMAAPAVALRQQYPALAGINENLMIRFSTNPENYEAVMAYSEMMTDQEAAANFGQFLNADFAGGAGEDGFTHIERINYILANDPSQMQEIARLAKENPDGLETYMAAIEMPGRDEVAATVAANADEEGFIMSMLPEGMRDMISGMQEMMQGIMGPLMEAIGPLMQNLMGTIGPMFEQLSGSLGSFFGSSDLLVNGTGGAYEQVVQPNQAVVAEAGPAAETAPRPGLGTPELDSPRVRAVTQPVPGFEG